MKYFFRIHRTMKSQLAIDRADNSFVWCNFYHFLKNIVRNNNYRCPKNIAVLKPVYCCRKFHLKNVYFCKDN